MSTSPGSASPGSAPPDGTPPDGASPDGASPDDTRRPASPAVYSPPPLKGSALALGTISLSLATFMNVLDTSIANVSLPSISGDMGVSPDQGTWVITSFAVANAISVPLTGWLTVRYGQVRLFLSAIVLFVAASLLCGLATSINELILFRVIQGAVAGPMIPLSQSLLLSSYPRDKSGTALGMWSITTMVAPVAGPLLGGWITDNISWPWIFYINVPVGIVAATATWLIYHRRETPRQQIPIDGVGVLLLGIWVGSLQLMLDKGKDQDWFQSPLIVTLAVVAVLGLALFVVWELTDEHPVVDLRLFKRRNFLTGTISVSLTYGAYFGSIVLLPLWLQEYMGYTATDAGMALAPVGALALFMTPLVGRYSHRFDPRVLASAALLLFAVVSAMRGRFNTTVDLWTIIIPTVIQGGAVSMFFIPLISLSLAGLSPRQIPAATGLNNFLRITAGAFGTSIATTLWDHFASMHHERLVAHVTVHDPAAVRALSTLKSAGLTGVQADAYLNQIINQQAYTMAASDVFYASAVLLLVLVPLLWLAGRRRAQPSPEGAGVH